MTEPLEPEPFQRLIITNGDGSEARLATDADGPLGELLAEIETDLHRHSFTDCCFYHTHEDGDLPHHHAIDRIKRWASAGIITIEDIPPDQAVLP